VIFMRMVLIMAKIIKAYEFLEQSI
jgi:hypothetical protein